MGEEFVEVVPSLKTGKIPGMENILPEWRRVSTNSAGSDMPKDLGDKGMADGVDTIARRTFTQRKATSSTFRTIVPAA